MCGATCANGLRPRGRPASLLWGFVERSTSISGRPLERTEFRGTHRYELRSLLGVGAMGVVYEAFDRELGTRVALKCLPSTSPQAFLRFKREFRALQDLHHENLVRLGELVYASEQLFFTMELVEGSDIVAYCWREETRASVGTSPVEAGDITLDGRFDAVPSRRTSTRLSPPGAPDMERVRRTFAALVRGLMALHAAEQVHRDVKPSNVLVTRAGRVVLLDFGVATAESSATPAQADARPVGTVEYMAPEQSSSGRTGRAADYYSVGAMLFEALTGRLPFEGSSAEVLEKKRHRTAPRARDLSPAVPEALDALCARLLDIDPERRPSGTAILAALEATVPSAEQPRRASRSLFVGRRRELDALRRWLSEARPSKPSVIHVEGESGTGKTTLVRHFLDGLLEEPETLVLRGRCSEREYVPYKALDGVVDGLAEFVASTDFAPVVATLERHLPELVRTFPVLGKIRGEERADSPPSTSDPYVRRLSLFDAFRSLLASVCAHRRVILALDDMQWADADSLALLSAVLRPPLDVSLPLVVVSRPYWAGRSFVRAFGGETLEVDKLAQEEAATLASGLLVASGCDEPSAGELAARIACEADGHPMFIDELAQRAAREGGSIAEPITLDAALWARVERLDSLAQNLVKLVAVAGNPLRVGTLARAAARDNHHDFPTLAELQVLRKQHLLRFDGTEAASRVEPYHDRVAVAVRARLSGGEQRDLHATLAAALEASPDRDPAELAVHWLGAGEPARAADYAVSAAANAEAALAFERAGRLYQMALECGPHRPDAPALYERMGDALANAGLGSAAARAYLAATGHDELRTLDLERRAADQLFRSGHIDEAEPLIQRVLFRMGVSVPRSSFWSLVALIVSRARLWFTRLERLPSARASVDEREVALLNACWSVGVGLSMVNNIRGACLQSRYLILAHRLGQPLPLLKGLASEAGYVAVTGQGARKRSEALIRRAELLAERIGESYATGFVTLAKAISAFLMGDWAASQSFARASQAVFETRPAGAMWELASARTFELWSSFYLGDFERIRARIGDFIQQAETRGDRYAATLHRSGLVVMAWLAADEVAVARQHVLEAEAGWSRAAFDFQRYLITLGNCLIDLYEGSPQLAHRRLTEIWSGLTRSLYLRIQNLRFEALYVRGASAIGAATQAPNGEALLRDAERCARRILRERVGWADALATLLSAGIADVRGDRMSALDMWRAAAEKARAHGMELFADAAEFRAALTQGGAAGMLELEAVRKRLAARAIREPDRICAALSPGVPVAKLRLVERG
ncbi:MAG TPA: protein kinase [Polyangiaceae bacterium]